MKPTLWLIMSCLLRLCGSWALIDCLKCQLTTTSTGIVGKWQLSDRGSDRYLLLTACHVAIVCLECCNIISCFYICSLCSIKCTGRCSLGPCTCTSWCCSCWLYICAFDCLSVWLAVCVCLTVCLSIGLSDIYVIFGFLRFCYACLSFCLCVCLTGCLTCVWSGSLRSLWRVCYFRNSSSCPSELYWDRSRYREVLDVLWAWKGSIISSQAFAKEEMLFKFLNTCWSVKVSCHWSCSLSKHGRRFKGV